MKNNIISERITENEEKIATSKMTLLVIVLAILSLIGCMVYIYFSLSTGTDLQIIESNANQCLSEIVGNCIVK